MSLPARERRVLEHIEMSLQSSDPKLTALYALFCRLTADEDIPPREQLRRRVFVLGSQLRLRLYGLSACLRRGLRRLAAVRRIRLVPRQPALLFFPLALAILVASMFFAVRAGSGGRCLPVRQAAAARYLTQSRLCHAPPMVTPPTSGR